jgi:hypothetical protein
MESLQISTQLLNQIIGYLGTRPYQEVHQIIQALQQEAANQLAAPQAPSGGSLKELD